MLDVLPAGHCGLAALSHLRGPSVLYLHHDHVRNSTKRHLEWRNWHRTVEERGGAMGQEVPMEKHRIGVWKVFNSVVVAFQPTEHQVKDGKLSVPCLDKTTETFTLQCCIFRSYFRDFKKLIFCDCLNEKSSLLNKKRPSLHLSTVWLIFHWMECLQLGWRYIKRANVQCWFHKCQWRAFLFSWDSKKLRIAMRRRKSRERKSWFIVECWVHDV